MAAPAQFVLRRLARLRFPKLFVLTAVLFVADLFVPDVIPFVDELLLGMGTMLLGSLRRSMRRGGQDQAGGG